MQTRQNELSKIKDFDECDELLRNSLHSFLLPTRSPDKSLPQAIPIIKA